MIKTKKKYTDRQPKERSDIKRKIYEQEKLEREEEIKYALGDIRTVRKYEKY